MMNVEQVSAPAPPLLDLRNLRVTFKRRGVVTPAVMGLSYQLSLGKTLAIIGESGSGKTVSCRALLGLLPPTAHVSGSARLNGRELLGLTERQMRKHRGADVAMIFQDPARSLNPTMRVGPQITEALQQHEHMERDDAQRRAVELLDLLRVPAASQRFFAYPHELSGGTRQRVVIAIALACNPRLLIADEATRSLDAITQAEILFLLKDLQRQLGMALIMVSHDLRLASSFADDTIVMYAGRAVEQAPTKRLFRHPRMRYTQALLDAIPRLDRPPHSCFPVIRGQPPQLGTLLPGCPFSSRCPSAREHCNNAEPAYTEHEHGHWWACWHPSADKEAHS